MRLFGSKVDVEVTTDRRAYMPGETVQVRVAIRAGKALEIDEARAELVYENKYTYRDREWTSRGSGQTMTHTTTDSAVRDKRQFLEAGSVSGDSQHSVELTVPADAPPSGKGGITEVRWKVQAVLSRRHKLDPDGSAEIAVQSPPAQYAAWAVASPDLDTHGDCSLELRLPSGPHLRAGEALAGTLVVTPHEPISLQEARVELVRNERVPRDVGNREEKRAASAVIDHGGELSTGIPRELPFSIELPADTCPCLETGQSTVRWFLRGVLARRLRSDHTIEQAVNVYTGTGDVPDTAALTDAVNIFKRPAGSGS
jgi:Arrestin (or S-antigen), C-terminal domain